MKSSDDSHMMKYYTSAHPGIQKPQFTQVVVRQFKSALDRQIGEAIRIQLRGNTLNSAGVYNRCRLTRLVVDKQWDEQVWKDSWKEPRFYETEDNLPEIVEHGSKRTATVQQRDMRKKLKLENQNGQVWGKKEAMGFCSQM